MQQAESQNTFWRVQNGQLWLHVKVKPGAKNNGILGLREDENGQQWLHVSITGPAEDGKANKALIAFLSRQLDVKQADIDLATGATSRLKRLVVKNTSASLLRKVQGLT